MRAKFAILLGLLLMGFVRHSSAVQTQVVSYSASHENFANPERGFYIQRTPLWINGERYPLESEDLESAKTQGISLIRTYYILEDYRDVPLPDDFFAMLQADFTIIRQTGFKVILRFSYNFPTNDDYTESIDAPLAMVLHHLEQLTPILHENKDIIAHMDAGFVGAWGEWHSSSNRLIEPNGSLNDASKAIIEALLAALPSERMIALRYPLLKQELFGPDPLSSEMAYNQTPQARIGAHNDCFLASDDNWGTYLDAEGEEQIDFFKNYLSTDNRFVVQSGETCNTAEDAQPFIGCENALNELALLHWSSLNVDYHPDVLEGWRAEGCFEEIAQRLGYRLRLIEAEAPPTAEAGDSWTVHLTLINEGFAAPYNPRDFELWLEGEDGARHPLELLETPDPRFWLPDMGKIELTLEATLPDDLPNGVYELLLALPDPALSDRPDYALRFANEDLWEDGYHRMNLRVRVD